MSELAAPGHGHRLWIGQDAAAGVAEATLRWVDTCVDALRRRGRCTVALSGGSTPRPLYEKMAKTRAPGLDWSKVQIWFVDERCVPPDDKRSNYRLIKESLLDQLPVAPEAIFRMEGENVDVEAAARAYEAQLKTQFPKSPGEPLPRFDFMVLGMGPDGHTASIFPGSPHLTSSQGHDRLVMPVVSPDGLARLTLTLPTICASRRAMVLANGADKAGTLRRVLKETVDPVTLPIQAVQLADGAEVEWILDKSICGELLNRETMAIRRPPGGFGGGEPT